MNKNKFLVFVIILISINCRRPELNTNELVIISKCKLPGYARDLDIKGNYAYIADDQGGLQIVDISNPESTFVIGSYFHQTNIQGLAIRDSLAYLALAAGPPNNGGMLILNVSDPRKPVFVGQDNWFYGYNVFAPAHDTQYVYIAARYWFIVEDVSWPQYPSYARRFATPGNVHNLFVIDSLVFLACEQMGLIIYNLNNPDSTAKIGEMDTPSNARDLYVINGFAYIADGYDGIVIIDVNDPYNPIFINSFDTPGYAQGVYVDKELAYVADGSGGLKVIDVADHENPVLYGEIETPYAYNVVVKDDIIYLVDRDWGLVIIKKESNR
ncbi:MAG: LVIVD repeat-containing protein [bacterium]